MKKYRIVKLSDDKFEGDHPNGIFEGYSKQGAIFKQPKVGERFICGNLITSTVTEGLNKDGVFKTNNSTYKLEEIKVLQNEHDR